MTRVAVLGYGIVGAGVVKVIMEGSTRFKDKLTISHILEIREVNDEYKDKVVKDINVILADASTEIVVETIGGVSVAYEFTRAALSRGKHVVTSNKELIATKGKELFALAAANNVRYLFEASVGGGIPILRPLNTCLMANEINYVAGILNGTTNYILTKMQHSKLSFDEALKLAQEKGYAEANPASDVEGKDTCRKIAILSGLSYSKQLPCDDIPTQGITAIEQKDMEIAANIGKTIKLIGYSKNSGGNIYCWVAPVLMDNAHPFANVNGAHNVIMVNGSNVGDVMFWGKGAGSMPTASAVVADVIDIARNCNNDSFNWTDGSVAQDMEAFAYYIRFEADYSYRALLNQAFPNMQYACQDDNDIAITTEPLTPAQLSEKLKLLEGKLVLRNALRIAGESQ